MQAYEKRADRTAEPLETIGQRAVLPPAPVALPVSYCVERASTGQRLRIHLTYDFARIHVEGENIVHLKSLTSYRGLGVRVEREGDNETAVIELLHDDPFFTLPLQAAENQEDICDFLKIWEAWAWLLELDRFVNMGSGDWQRVPLGPRASDLDMPAMPAHESGLAATNVVRFPLG